MSSMETTPQVAATPAPRLRKAAKLIGHTLVLRNAELADAAFILQLRLDARRNQFMAATSAQLADQTAWLQRYAQDDTQAYFIITRREGDAGAGESLGTVRLTDAQGLSFCWGSWMMVPHAPAGAALESALMVYHFARALGFEQAHFEVHKDNAPVRRFHERFGAVSTSEHQDQVQYQLPSTEMVAGMGRYSKKLPHGCQVHW